MFAHGVGERELAATRPFFGQDLPRSVAIALPERPVRLLLDDFDATDELRNLGVTVDRSALLLRPARRTDATAADRVGAGPMGPASATLFESTDVLGAARIGGERAALAASTQLGCLVARLAERLRRGDLPEIWLLGSGSPEPVHTTVDPGPLLDRHLPPPLAGELTVRTAAGSVVIAAANTAALLHAARTLAAPPFSGWGTVRIDDNEARLSAHRGYAFGRRRLAARMPHAKDAVGVVAAPLGSTTPATGIPFEQLIARFWMRAARHVAAAPEPDRAGVSTAERRAPATEGVVALPAR